MNQDTKDKIEFSSAVMCIAAAIAIGITSIVISQTHNIEAGVLIFIAQLLIFAASVYQINYKIYQYGESSKSKDDKSDFFSLEEFTLLNRKKVEDR